MSSERRTFIKALGSIAAVSQLPAQPSGKPYGSGHFGEWIDDAFGLLFALGRPAADLIGVSTVAGNVSLAKATRNT